MEHYRFIMYREYRYAVSGSICLKGGVMYRILVVLLLVGCGSDCDTCINISPNTSFSHECSTRTPRGICVVNRSNVEFLGRHSDQIDSTWENAKTCLGMTAEPPTVEFLPLDYFVPGHNGVTFSNGYISVSQIDIDRFFWISRHEFIHYLPLKNGLPNWKDHDNGYFDKCESL